MLVTWIVAAGIIVFAQAATRKIKRIPTGAQNFWEWMVEGLYSFLESVIGPQLVKKTFWFFATIFIFILFLNWFGLIPGVGTVGWGHHDPATNSFHVDRPLLRGANADLNLTLAMASVFFVLWLIWAIQANGIGGFILHLFGPKGETSGLLKVLMIVVFFLVGWLEVVSILFRPGLAQLSFVRKYLRGREHVGVDGQSGALAFLADSDSVLLHGVACRNCAGPRLHVIDGGLHAPDCATRTGTRSTPLKISAEQSRMNRESRRKQPKKEI